MEAGMQTKFAPPAATRGIALIESLIALLVLGFGLVALAGFQLGLSRHADVARQRSEATRLAQEKLEALRAFSQLDSASGVPAYADIAAGADTPALASNTAYARTWRVASDARDAQRTIAIDVGWSDRAGVAQRVTLQTIVARSDPLDAGSLIVPAAAAWRRTLERSGHVPFAATRLGGANRGKSTLTWSGPSGGHLVFDDASGAIVARCAAPVTDTTSIASSCAALDGYLLQGYIGGALPGSAPTLVFDQLQYLAASTVPECSLAPAIDQNSGAAIAGTLQYRCLLQPTDHDANAATPRVWSGRLRLAGLPQGSVSCRYAPQPETYTLVAAPLEQQNLVISASASCPAGSVLHPSA
jgi:Tfp pilus assembly protein PilV